MKYFIKTKSGFVRDFNKSIKVVTFTKMITLAKSFPSKQAAASWFRRNDVDAQITGNAQVVIY